jgi:hypothetical protein
VAGDETTVPADDGLWLHDQHDLRQPRSCERGGQHREDGPVRVGEAGPVDLALRHQDLMPQNGDLSVSLVAGRE